MVLFQTETQACPQAAAAKTKRAPERVNVPSHNPEQHQVRLTVQLWYASADSCLKR